MKINLENSNLHIHDHRREQKNKTGNIQIYGRHFSMLRTNALYEYEGEYLQYLIKKN